MKRHLIHLLSAAAIAAALSATAAHAQVTGTIKVSLTLTSACTIDALPFVAGSAAGAIEHAPLTFPNTPTTVTGSDATVTSYMAISYKCSNGANPTLALNGGVNSQGSVRRMKHGTLPQHIPYNLYRAADGEDPIAINDILNLTGNNTPRAVTIYGVATIPADLNVGEYTDTITVTLTL